MNNKYLILLSFCFVLTGINAQNSVLNYLTAMEKRLTEEEKKMLQMIYEPVVVGIPPTDARADVCIMPNGEIRAYGFRYQTRKNPAGERIYLSSTDCGLTWKQHFTKEVMGAATYFPELDLWVKCDPNTTKEGTFVLTSRIGPDDPNPTKIKVSDEIYQCAFLPQQIEGANRIFFTAQVNAKNEKPAAFFYSDDGCQTFQYIKVHQPKEHEVTYPHQGPRWRIGNGTEPTVSQLSPGYLMMLLRNSTNHFYQTFSSDNGTTWSVPQPSPFQGCNTTPFQLKLSDGRVMVFWNNTRPLAELDHTTQVKVYDNNDIKQQWQLNVCNGATEDHFTNRDASHVAITNDGGKTWIGARELYLNSIRNNPDFRFIGTPLSSNDKSVHQFQAFELPFNKVLVVVGQNEISRRFLIFDIDWLFESIRNEDFDLGLVNVSTQVYLKSVAGHVANNGHCAYNRTHGAIKAIDPITSTRGEAVQISRIDDPRLVSQIQGLVWNFPAATQGSIETEIYLAQDAAYISLNDCWTNPCDEYAPEFSLFSFHIDQSKMPLKRYHKVKFTFDLNKRTANMYINNVFVESCTMRRDFCIGLSYINIQCDAPQPSEGLYVKSLNKQ